MPRCLLSSCKTLPGVARRRLGLLAVALGSGAVQVLAVPRPGALAARQSPAAPPQQPASAAANGAAEASGHAHGSAAGAGARQGPPAGNTAAAGTPAIVELRPVALAAAGSLGSGLPSSVEWLPGEPHDRLLVRVPGTVAAGRRLAEELGPQHVLDGLA